MLIWGLYASEVYIVTENTFYLVFRFTALVYLDLIFLYVLTLKKKNNLWKFF